MSKGLGALVFVAGVAGLTFWGAKVQAVSIEHEITAAAQAAAADTTHPLEMRVSGRDITVTGVADSEAEIAGLAEELEGVRGRRVVNLDGITVLPRVEPYETALAKGADGLAATGYVPSEAARAALAEAGLPVADLPLASGAPAGWAEAVTAGAAALAPLDQGSFAVTGNTLTLQGMAATPVEDEAARAALQVPADFETVVALEVADPGVVDFVLSGNAAEGYMLDGIVPRGLGVEGIAAALGHEVIPGEVRTTFAEAPGLEAALGGFAKLDVGRLSLTGDKLSLSGVAATPAESEALRAALGGYETELDLEVADPGVVDFSLGFDADTGFTLDGIVPEGFGVAGFAEALGADVAVGEVKTTFADLPGLGDTLSGLGGALDRVESLTIHGSNDGFSATAEALAGIDTRLATSALGRVFGRDVPLDVTEVSDPPQDGTERQNPVTGIRQFAHGGAWLTLPAGLEDPTPELCARTAMERVAQAPIRFVTGSAELDPDSRAVIEDLAGILNLCTRGPGMHVTIGGHTDSTGEPEKNYVLSAQRARAVKDALAALGVPPGRMMAIGYGDTEPVADNETEEGRALNRRTTFTWPD